MSDTESEPVEVQRTGGDAEGTYVVEVPGIETPAKLVWRAQDADTRIAVSTFVPEEMRGMGIAGKLVDALIADARSIGFRIVPQCPYVAAQFKRHPEWGDLLA